MIMVAVGDGRPLPPVVTDWMERWLELRHQRPGALVAMLNSAWSQLDDSRGMLPQLTAAAAHAHLDFFVTRAKEPSDEVWGQEVGVSAFRFFQGAICGILGAWSRRS